MHKAISTRIHSNATRKYNIKYHKIGKEISRLCNNTPRRNRHLLSQRHDPGITQRHLLPIRKKTLEADQEDTFSCLVTPISHQTMEPHTLQLKPPKHQFTQQQKPNWELCIKISKKPSQNKTQSNKWDTKTSHTNVKRQHNSTKCIQK